MTKRAERWRAQNPDAYRAQMQRANRRRYAKQKAANRAATIGLALEGMEVR